MIASGLLEPCAGSFGLFDVASRFTDTRHLFQGTRIVFIHFQRLLAVVTGLLGIALFLRYFGQAEYREPR